MTQAIIGYDTTWELETAAASGVFQELEEMKSGGLPNEEQEQQDATHMKSPNRTREFVAGFINGGDVTLTMNWVPASPTDELIIGWKADGSTRKLRCTTPGGALTVTFPAIYRSYETPLENESVSVATLVAQVAGATVRT